MSLHFLVKSKLSFSTAAASRRALRARNCIYFSPVTNCSLWLLRCSHRNLSMAPWLHGAINGSITPVMRKSDVIYNTRKHVAYRNATRWLLNHGHKQYATNKAVVDLRLFPWPDAALVELRWIYAFLRRFVAHSWTLCAAWRHPKPEVNDISQCRRR